MSAVVQQIVYTSQPERWWALAEALGFSAPSAPTSQWGEFDANGTLAVHRADGQHPAGAVDIHLLVPDLDAAASALADFETERSVMEGVGDLLIVQVSSGVRVTVSAGISAATSGCIGVQPIWFEADLTEPRAILEALGLRADIVADRGGWVEMLADGGCVGLHEGDARIGLSFEARGDLDALAERVQRAGFAVSVVDEAFARTLRIADPDGGDEVWVNGIQDDLHGYHRES